MARTQEIYEILVQTALSTAELERLTKQAEATTRALKDNNKAAKDFPPKVPGVANLNNDLNALEKRGRETGRRIQNVGFQVQDFAVQVSGGTSAVRALGQQLPQVFAAFGAGNPIIAITIAAVSTLAALLPILIGAMSDTVDVFADAQKALEKYNEASSTLQGTISSAEGLQKRYAEAVASNNKIAVAGIKEQIAATEGLMQLQAEALAIALRDQEAAVAAGAARLATMEAEQVALDNHAASMQTAAMNAVDYANQVGFAAESQDDATNAAAAHARELDKVRKQQEKITLELRLAKGEATEFGATVGKTSIILKGLASGFTAIVAGISSANGGVTTMNALLAKAAGLAASVGANIAGALSRVMTLSTRIAQAYQQYADTRVLGNEAAAEAETARLKKLAQAYQVYGATRREASKWPVAEVKDAGGGGGGAEEIKATAEQLALVNEALAKAGPLVKDAAYGYDQLTEAMRAVAKDGGISDEDVARLEQHIKKLKENAKAVQDVFGMVGSGVQAMFDSLIEGTASVSDAFQTMLVDILQDVAKFLISRQITSLMNMFGSMAGGSGGMFTTPIFPASNAIVASTATVTGPPGAVQYGNPTQPIIPARYGAGYGSPSASAAANAAAAPLVVTINNTQAEVVEVKAEEKKNVNGERELHILVERKVKEVIGSGSMDRTMQQAYGLRRRPG